MKIGILDPKGKNLNPLTNNKYSKNYLEMAKVWSEYPAYKEINNILKCFKNNSVLLITSGTGSGKTVIVPKALLHFYDYKKKIFITLPKQIITKSAATYSSLTLDVKVGEEVGYKYRGCPKNSYNKSTKLLYITDGSLVSNLIKDPLLKDYNGVIIDEAHERKLQIDLLFYLLKKTLSKRNDFKLIIMSATINVDIFEKYYRDFGFFHIDLSTKPNYEIQSLYIDCKGNYIKKGVEIIKNLINNEKFDSNLLFFISSIKESYEVCNLLSQDIKDYKCIEVYSNTSEDKKKIVEDNSNKKIIISTNVAESSLTISNVKYVIDCGYEIYGYYDCKGDSKVIEKRFISKAQVKQRMGRTGRTSKGICYHLYSENDYMNMREYPEPLIKKGDLTDISLKILSMKDVGNVENLYNIYNGFLDIPSILYINTAINKLNKLNLISYNKISKLGEVISRFNLDYQFSLTIFVSIILSCNKEVSKIISLLTITKLNILNIFSNNIKDNKKVMEEYYHSSGDLITILNIYNKMELKLDDDLWISKNFNKELIPFIISLEEKITYQSKRKFSKFINIEEEFNNDINDRIIISFIYGFGLDNICFLENNKYKNVNNLDLKIPDSSWLFNKSIKSKLFFLEIIKSFKTKMNIVSIVPDNYELIYGKIESLLSI